jgi:hypothetical protein
MGSIHAALLSDTSRREVTGLEEPVDRLVWEISTRSLLRLYN